MALLPFLRLHYHLFFFSVRTEQNCLPFVSSIPCWLVNDVPITAICQEAESRVRTYFEHDESVRGPVILDETNVWTVINAFICQKPCYFMRHYVAMYLGILRENNCAVLTTSLSLSLEAAAEPQTFPKQNCPRLLDTRWLFIMEFSTTVLLTPPGVGSSLLALWSNVNSNPLL